MEQEFDIRIADETHQGFAQIICDEMESSAKARGTGIAKRSPDYIKEKMREGKSVIAFTSNGVTVPVRYTKKESTILDAYGTKSVTVLVATLVNTGAPIPRFSEYTSTAGTGVAL